jgi:hypothetical protein
MRALHQFGFTCVLATLVGTIACSSVDEGTEEIAASEHAKKADPSAPPAPTASETPAPLPEAPLPPGQDQNCRKAEPKDVMIAQLVKDSWMVDYPLTRLVVAADGTITGPDLPDVLAGDLQDINNVPEARASVARALRKVSGLPDYGMADIGPDMAACDAVPAYAHDGTIITVPTTANWVHTDGTNDGSWKTTHKEFGKECPLLKTVGNRDIIDPPGDGSTMLPPSTTVSATGVKADSFGRCPTGTTVGTYCKLSYATGVNYTGRWCQYYYGSLKCVLKP